MSPIDTRTPCQQVRDALDVPPDVSLRRIMIEPKTRVVGQELQHGVWLRIDPYLEERRPPARPFTILPWATEAQAEAVAYALAHALDVSVEWRGCGPPSTRRALSR